MITSSCWLAKCSNSRYILIPLGLSTSVETWWQHASLTKLHQIDFYQLRLLWNSEVSHASSLFLLFSLFRMRPLLTEPPHCVLKSCKNALWVVLSADIYEHTALMCQNTILNWGSETSRSSGGGRVKDWEWRGMTDKTSLVLRVWWMLRVRCKDRHASCSG